MALFLIMLAVLFCFGICVYWVITVPNPGIRLIAGLGMMISGFPIVIMITVAGSMWFGWTYRVASLDVGNGRKIELRAPQWNKDAHPVLYQAWDRGKKFHPRPAVCAYLPEGTYDARGMKFELHAAADGDLVAVTESSKPGVLLILHDFAAGWSWSAQDEQPTAQQRDALDRLIKEHPELAFP